LSIDSQATNDLPQVFTEAQEERIRQIVREEIQKAKVEDLDAGFEE
jgi:hypothetical protein